MSDVGRAVGIGLIAAAASIVGLAPLVSHAIDAEKCAAVRDDPSSLVRLETYGPDGARGTLGGILLRPPGAGPFPAVVILHRYFGIEPPECFIDEQKRFASQNWISLIIDSNSADPAVRSGAPDTRTGYSHLDQAVDAWGAKCEAKA